MMEPALKDLFESVWSGSFCSKRMSSFILLESDSRLECLRNRPIRLSSIVPNVSMIAGVKSLDISRHKEEYFAIFLSDLDFAAAPWVAAEDGELMIAVRDVGSVTAVSRK